MLRIGAEGREEHWNPESSQPNYDGYPLCQATTVLEGSPKGGQA